MYFYLVNWNRKVKTYKMISTKEIIRGLNEGHYKEVHTLIKKSSFHKELIPILEKYRSGEFTEEEVREDTKFTLNEYKHLEKRLYNILVNFYRIDPKLELDSIMSQAFHALYSSESKADKSHENILENVFNKMQSRHLAEEGLEILGQLVELKKDSELHTVYHHLYNHYLNRNFSNKRSLILLTQFFNKMNNFDQENEKEDIRQLIFIYKQLRLLSKEANNPLSNVIYRISQLTMLVHFNQTQLLFQEKISLQKLYFNCEKNLQMMPGNFERFYLNNILLQLKLKAAVQNNDYKSYRSINKLFENNPKMLTANNFNFHLDIKELEYQYLAKKFAPISSTAKKLSLIPEGNFKLSNIDFPKIIFQEDGKNALYNS